MNRIELPSKFWDRIQTGESCWIWMGSRNDRGYGQFRFHGKLQYVHRLMYMYQYGDFDRSLFVCHTCDTRLCVNPTHIWLGTNADNVADMIAKGRQNIGTHNPMVKIGPDDVREIRKRIARGDKQRIIAADFGLSPSNINAIKVKRSWSHVS